MQTDIIFEGSTEFPDPDAQRRFAQLVGLDEVKSRLVKEARLLLNPQLLEDWSRKYHQGAVAATQRFRDRAPLFLLAGDVGTGKTELAESFGDAIARAENLPVTLFRLSLNSRGSGAVGEMTRLLSTAFQEVLQFGKRGMSKGGKTASAAVLLIDEADAIAQSRESAQMHHEDRAGVNAMIRGISALASANVPVLVIMCTNRLDALDPAIRRRAAATFTFARPDDQQRYAVLSEAMKGTGFSETQISAIAALTGPTSGRPYGFTYSDLTQRLIPAIVLDAFPDKPIMFDRAAELAQQLLPTPPFLRQSEV